VPQGSELATCSMLASSWSPCVTVCILETIYLIHMGVETNAGALPWCAPWCARILRLRPLEQSDNYDSAEEEEDAREASAQPHTSTLRYQDEGPGPTLSAVARHQGTQRRATKAAKGPPPLSSPHTQARTVNPWLLVKQVRTGDNRCLNRPVLLYHHSQSFLFHFCIFAFLPGSIVPPSRSCPEAWRRRRGKEAREGGEGQVEKEARVK
jgi:hypothetical protein